MLDLSHVQMIWSTNLNAGEFAIHAWVPFSKTSGIGAILTPQATAGALALLCWDICITFGDEVEYIWP
jgi:hypothetical protein